MSAPSNRERLSSLDVMRGATVALMILVNNGGGSEHFPTLVHSKWNGLTLCDIVFPFFLFMVGVSIYLSFRKFDFLADRAVLVKILKRTLGLFLIGLAINWFDLACKGRPLDFAHLRIWGVMQRIALCYGIAALLAVTINRKAILPLAALLLFAYTAILLFGHGYSQDPSLNILSRVDRALFGENHLYTKSAVDPEGLLGTISGVAHTLIGLWCGFIIGSPVEKGRKASLLACIGAVLAVGGLILTLSLPLNKRIWSPSYVLLTCGMASVVLGALMYIIDVKGWKGWISPFLVFGMNALFLYVLSEVLCIAFGATGISDAAYGLIEGVVSAPKWASLAYALLFVAVCWAAGYPLYRKRIFIKI